MNKYIFLVLSCFLCNATQAAVYMIDFECDQEAYEVFATMSLAELDGQFLDGSRKLARYHDLTTGSGIVLVEADDPVLVIEFANGWSELCESKITPVVEDAEALARLTR